MHLIATGLLCLLCVSLTITCQSRWDRSSSPVLEFRPSPPDGSTLFWFKPGGKTTQYWKNAINEFLKPYHQQHQFENVVACDHSSPQKHQVCHVKLTKNFAPCVPEYSYGLEQGSACIFLTLTQFPKGWLPRYYNRTDLPNEMPEYLKEAVRRTEQQGSNQKVWVSCQGEFPADMENLGPQIYFPFFGFDPNYLLNTKVKGYLSPLVAVHFESPTRGVLINVLCTAWARNIPRELEANLGTVHFELLVD